MDIGLEARELTLEQLLAPGESYLLPPYQRSYSWGEKEADALISDLIEACESDTNHFIGAIVVVSPRRNGPSEIVDGQQRLTTLTMLLAVMRDLETRSKVRDTLQKLIGTKSRSLLSETIHWQLTLNQIDGAFFRENVQTLGASIDIELGNIETESQQRIADNIALFKAKLTELDAELRQRLGQFVVSRCTLVRVRVLDRDTGYGVFRVLNTRGKQPNAHDIVKTEMFERAQLEREEADGFARAWGAYEARLGAGGFDDLLRQVRMLYDRSGRGDVIAGFRRLLENGMDPRRFLELELPRFVDGHEQISSGRARQVRADNAITVHLNRLRSLDHTGWRAPALKFIVENGTDDPRAGQFFEALERLAFALQFVVIEREARNRRYRRVVDSLNDAQLLFSDDGPLALTADEKTKFRHRLHGRFGSFGQRRALALRLNAALAPEEQLTPEDDATVEHVLPRNPAPRSDWLRAWPDISQRRELCDTIGNLVLLPYDVNQEADRLDFQKKHGIFFGPNSPKPFALTRDIEGISDWTPAIVKARTERLAQLLSNIWKLN